MNEPVQPARPHQLIFEKHHHNVNDVVVAYVNYLEARCSMFEREMMASHEREMVRNRNTDLEIQNRELRAKIATMTPARPVGETVHPWDIWVPPSADNPLAITARELIVNLRSSVQDLTQERESLIEDKKQINKLSWLRGFTRESGNWCLDTFGEEVYLSRIERGARLLEESVEVAQCLGVPFDMAQTIVANTYSKPKGSINQELGGVIVCWAVAVQALKLDGLKIIKDALVDCWARQEETRKKFMNKINLGTSLGTIHPMEPRPQTMTGGASTREPYAAAPKSPDAVIQEGRDNLKKFIDEANPR